MDVIMLRDYVKLMLMSTCGRNVTKKSHAERSVLAVELTLFFRCCILVALIEVAEEAEESAAVGGVRPHERALLQAAGAVQRDGLLGWDSRERSG